MTKPTFHIVSDGSCDLPLPETEKLGVDTVRFLVSFDGEHYKKEGLEVPLEDFYQKMVDEPGTYPMTAAPSPDDFCQYFGKYAAAGEDVLCICISTKLSSSLQSAQHCRADDRGSLSQCPDHSPGFSVRYPYAERPCPGGLPPAGRRSLCGGSGQDLNRS